MKSLSQLCVPRTTVFDRSIQDTVLDLTDLTENSIDPYKFFEENYLTSGMNSLLKEAFRRFKGESASGVIKLKQAMGGGKTHCMIALGLLAKYPNIRDNMLGAKRADNKQEVTVVAFSGRESDAPFGIWGSIAEQLGKKSVFNDYYSPLGAPGQSAWINLLKSDKPLLILLDELPPYFEYARSRKIGNSDLAVITTTALSNLLVAVNKKELSNVCVVISDLSANYETGSESINTALKNLENEVGRSAIELEPVGLNTDEVYQILKKRLFEKLPNDGEIAEIASEYAQAVKDATQMGITNISADTLNHQVRESYPFHPAIKDLYARFRENPGFQQTRGLIRLMRVIIADLFKEEGSAGSLALIHPHNFDLKNLDVFSEITRINPHLENAISKDISADGAAFAEILDESHGGSDAQDICKLVLMSSLADIPNSVLGLTKSEICSYLCSPRRDISNALNTIETLKTETCWYLHEGRDGRIFFKNVENLVAKLKSTVNIYNSEISLKELRLFLEEIFGPKVKDCYQEIIVFPAVDEILIVPEKVTLILYKPHSGGLHPDLQAFYDNLEYKNRVLFLSGQRDSMDSLIELGKEYKAIQYILDNMDKDGVLQSDPQRITALNLKENIKLRLLSAARETFTTITYPIGEQGLSTKDFMMVFDSNEYRGEKLIRETLKANHKFEDDVSSDSFRKKCELRLFTQQKMQWSQIKKRAAIVAKWQWHHPKALDDMKNTLIDKGQWREEGSYIDKGPFAKPTTSVQIQELQRDSDTGVATLKITPVYGDTVYYEYKSEATTGSSKVQNLNEFKTSEMKVYFLCVDSSNEHKVGEQQVWKNRVTLKKKVYGNSQGQNVELRVAPPQATIRYTTDGSNPKTNGGSYENPFVVTKSTKMVLAVGESGGEFSEELKLNIKWDESDPIDLEKPAKWNRRHEPNTTKDSYELIDKLKKYEGIASGLHILISGKEWIELSVDPKLEFDGNRLESILEALRGIYNDGEINIEINSIRFPSGQKLSDFAKDEKMEINSDEVDQV